MSTPAPGFVAPSPRTWSKGDIITAARLRADMTDLGYLFAGGARPMLLSVNGSSQALTTGGSPILINLGAQVPLNTWNSPVTSGTALAAQPYYEIPLAGTYLLQSDVTLNLGGTPANFKYNTGFDLVSNGSHSQTDTGSFPAVNSTNFLSGMDGCELVQFNSYAATADTAALYAFTNNSTPATVHVADFMVEWAGLPASGLTGYSGPYGTVVTSPQLVTNWPSGQGTSLFYAAAAGATSITVYDTTGMVAGGTLGLDYINGQLNTVTAEAVTITSISGTVIGITATAFPHAVGAPVAVPVSAAFLNQQVRDVVNFLSYPPMLRAVTTTTQSLPSQTFSSGTQITHLSASIDNFSGFASNAYTVPVSGIYLVYGQVYFAGSTSAFDAAAGLSQNGGTIQWGTRYRSTSSSARTNCATVRRHLRLSAGDTITLYGSQDVGGSMNTTASGTAFSKLIAVWRSV